MKLKELLRVMRSGDLFVFDNMTGTVIAKRLGGEWHFTDKRETLETIEDRDIAMMMAPYKDTNSVFIF